jgi:hypothetical protein
MRFPLTLQETIGLASVLAGGGLLLHLDLGGRHTPLSEVSVVDLIGVAAALVLLIGGIMIAASGEERR